MNWNVMENNGVNEKCTAGVKARDDVDAIVSELGFTPMPVRVIAERTDAGKFAKLKLHVDAYREWKKSFAAAKSGDVIFIQFPVISHSLLLSKAVKSLNRRGVKTVALLHDLETLRYVLGQSHSRMAKFRLKFEEVSVLKCFDKIIVHNSKMKAKVTEIFGISDDRLVDLEIFDYLIENPKQAVPHSFENPSVILAGNLRPDKATYAYDLPDNVTYDLYGPAYEGKEKENVRYHGAVAPDELPNVFEGSFGLVWDGTSLDSCNGAIGEYLKYNNPHKTSLYLAGKKPVLIWNQAALADFVLKNGCGLAIASLYEIPQKIASLSEADYLTMCQNADAVAQRLTAGYYTKKAIQECL